MTLTEEDDFKSRQSLLEEVVAFAGLELQSEDCAIRAAVHSRGDRGGLARIINERYYQFVVWRAALRKWHAEVERGTHDLQLSLGDDRHIFEMKCWRGEEGSDWPNIQRDIDKLRARPTCQGYVMVFSYNPLPDTSGNIAFLRENLKGVSWPQADYRFRTEDKEGQPIEFWVAAWCCL